MPVINELVVTPEVIETEPIKGRRVYISGAITNNPEAAAQFARAHKWLIDEGAADVFNPMAAGVQVRRPGWTHEQHMLADLHMLTSGHFDLLLQLPGWTTSGGAQLERAVADMCGIERQEWCHEAG